jgi:hypothetical protein
MESGGGDTVLARPGQRVLTLSGRHLGTVVSWHAEKFALAGENGTLWLRRDSVFVCDRANVTLICEREGLHRYVVGPIEPIRVA